MPKFGLASTISLIRVVKATDESRSSATTLTNDTDLLAAVEANSTYEVYIRLLVQGVTADTVLKVGPYGPSGYTFKWTLLGADVAATGQPASVYTRVQEEGSSTTTICMFSNDTWVEIKGTLLTSSTAGNFGIQWCQNSSSANATKILANSMLRLEKVA